MKNKDQQGLPLKQYKSLGQSTYYCQYWSSCHDTMPQSSCYDLCSGEQCGYNVDSSYGQGYGGCAYGLDCEGYTTAYCQTHNSNYCNTWYDPACYKNYDCFNLCEGQQCGTLIYQPFYQITFAYGQCTSGYGCSGNETLNQYCNKDADNPSYNYYADGGSYNKGGNTDKDTPAVRVGIFFAVMVGITVPICTYLALKRRQRMQSGAVVNV